MAGNIAKRPDGNWRARYRDEQGRERSRHFDRKIDAQRWLDEIAAAVLTGTYVDPDAGKDKHDGDSDSSNDTTHQAGEHRADEHRVDDGTGSTIGEGQRYDADGHPIRADGSRTDLDSGTGTHRA